MYSFNNECKKELKDLKFLIKQCRLRLGAYESETLEVRKINGTNYYYGSKKKSGKKVTRYIGTCDSEEVGLFIQHTVLYRQLQAMEHNLRLIEGLTDSLKDYNEDTLLSDLGEKYDTGFWNVDNLLRLQILEDDKIPAIRKKRHLANHSMRQIERQNVTTDGNVVRSKGEFAIYDILMGEEVFFDYEATLYLIDDKGKMHKINPDFVIHVGSEIIIIEHLGYMEDPEYVKQLAWKLWIYHLNGYDLGRNLFLTSDDMSHSIDGSTISDLITGVIKRKIREEA